MAKIIPFAAYMPSPGMEKEIAALPYDVYNRKEAKDYVEAHPNSFLRIDRPETNFPDAVDIYDDRVYAKAKELIEDYCQKDLFRLQDKKNFYLYQLVMDGRSQTGFVGLASVKDYNDNVVKKHENTLASKEKDRIRHISETGMQTGPIFLAFNSTDTLDGVMNRILEEKPYYDFVSEDGIGHRVWIVSGEKDIGIISKEFDSLGSVYIADGHHRCASACRVGNDRYQEGICQESDYFLSVLFPASQLKIMDYNRVIKDLGQFSTEEFIEKISEYYSVKQVDEQYHPLSKGEAGMYIDSKWYCITIRDQYKNNDPVEGLDVALMQKYIFDNILGIKDPKTDSRIDFVGGIRGLQELERRCGEGGDCVAAFAMYPTDIQELIAVADAGRLMPPKSTWFEPKLRSGLFLHKIGE